MSQWKLMASLCAGLMMAGCGGGGGSDGNSDTQNHQDLYGTYNGIATVTIKYYSISNGTLAGTSTMQRSAKFIIGEPASIVASDLVKYTEGNPVHIEFWTSVPPLPFSEDGLFMLYSWRGSQSKDPPYTIYPGVKYMTALVNGNNFNGTLDNNSAGHQAVTAHGYRTIREGLTISGSVTNGNVHVEVSGVAAINVLDQYVPKFIITMDAHR